MNPERLREIEELYHAARECGDAQRKAMLERADPELRREVQSLLSQDDQKGPIDRPMASMAAKFMGDSTFTQIAAGTQLGPYRIEARLGAGGMGEVFQATDTRLRRRVAIKITKEQFGERFEREARAIAALNHPNICQLYDVGPDYLVMEFIDGATLKGPLPIETALKYGAQICDALDAAHRKGITHRDLKPANILVTKQGVKLLDFGLAKQAGGPKETDSTLTREGEIAGTLNYMSPEQLQSKAVDGRSDIFSFGLVLYEMVTGKRAFAGESVASVMAAILEREAPSVTDVAPPALDRVLKTCLAKDPEERWQSARDLRRELEWAAGGSERHQEGMTRRTMVSGGIAAVATGAAVWGWIRTPQSAGSPAQEIAFTISPPPGIHLQPVGSLGVDRLSPDGSMIYFRAQQGRYYLRRLNSTESEPLPDWDWFGDPFWAPDSQSIAFPVRGQVLKLRVPKGAQEFVTDTGGERGGSWSDKGIIVLGRSNDGLYSAPASGGKTAHLDVPGLVEGRFYNPQFLPGGDDFLFAFVPWDSSTAKIYLASFLDGKVGNPKLLLENDTSVSFTPAGGGRILFVRKNNLYSQQFDLKARRLRGEPELLQEKVASWAGPRVAYFSVSRNGTIAWRSGTEVLSQVTILDRKGNELGSAGQLESGDIIQLSPDESRLLLRGEAGGGDTWIVDASGPSQTLVSLGHARGRLWSRDGSTLIFFRNGKIWTKPVTGSGEAREIADAPGEYLYGITPDDRVISGKIGGSWFRTQLRTGAAPEALPGQAFENGDISPGGDWVVFTKPDRALYVQRISAATLARQVAGRGNSAVWTRDGKEIVYRDRDPEAIWSIRVDGSGADLRFGKPEKLFSMPEAMGTTGGSRLLAVSRDGSKIYYLKSVEQPESGVIHVRTNAVR